MKLILIAILISFIGCGAPDPETRNQTNTLDGKEDKKGLTIVIKQDIKLEPRLFGTNQYVSDFSFQNQCRIQTRVPGEKVEKTIYQGEYPVISQHIDSGFSNARALITSDFVLFCDPRDQKRIVPTLSEMNTTEYFEVISSHDTSPRRRLL